MKETSNYSLHHCRADMILYLLHESLWATHTAIADLVASLCLQEYKEVVGGSSSQPPAAVARMGLAPPLAPGSRGRRCYGDCSAPSPDPPGWVPCDGTDPPGGVQQRELHGAGNSDYKGGEGRRRGLGHCLCVCVCLCLCVCVLWI